MLIPILEFMALQQEDLEVGRRREFESELVIDPNHPLAVAEAWRDSLSAGKMVRRRAGRLFREIEDHDSEAAIYAQRLLLSHRKSLECGSHRRIARSLCRSEPEVMQGLAELLNRNGQSELALTFIARSASLNDCITLNSLSQSESDPPSHS